MAAEKKPAEVNETPITEKAVKKAPPVATNASRKQEHHDAEETIEAALNKTEGFLYNNGKTLLIVLAAIVLIVGGFLGYKYIHLANRAEKAGETMFVAEQLFALDSFALALNGDGNNAGFLEVAETYASTPQGNIARHYAGVCYLKLGDADNALVQLEKYKTVNGAPGQIINAQNLGLRGDIYADKGDFAKAAELYKKAVDASDNDFTAPIFLKKLGLSYGKLGKSQEAIEAFQKIADFYPSSVEGRDISKLIGAEQQK